MEKNQKKKQAKEQEDQNLMSRREFLGKSLKAGAGLAVTAVALKASGSGGRACPSDGHRVSYGFQDEYEKAASFGFGGLSVLVGLVRLCSAGQKGHRHLPGQKRDPADGRFRAHPRLLPPNRQFRAFGLFPGRI